MAVRAYSKVSEGAPPGRVPPHNLEAEESVLGACMLSREAIANALEVLSAEDFYKPAHAEIFGAVLGLYAKGEPVDAITLAEELRRQGTLEGVGGKPYIHTLVASVPTPGSANHYARIVEENALLRRLIDAAHSISDVAFSVPDDVTDAIDQAENLIYKVSQRRVSSDFVPLKDLLSENMELVEKLYERGSSITGVATGFRDLDEITAGLQPANLIIVAARPSMGKSAFALSIAQQVAVNDQVPVVIFSLEMSKMELVQRLMCAEARVDSSRLRRGALGDSDWPRLSHALGRLAEAPIFIDDTPNMTIMEMRAKCRRLATKHGLGLIICDYLQLMAPPRRSDSRVQEVTEISRSLKILARELSVPVIAVSQLSRNVEYRSDKRPVLADLRECVAADTPIALSTGEQVPISSLVHAEARLISLDNWRVCRARAARIWTTGRKTVLKLETATGRVLRATPNHPLRTLGGWTALGGLRPGDRVAIPRVLPEPDRSQPWDSDRIILLAHLLGDGSVLRDQPVRYASADEANLAAVSRAAASAFAVSPRRVKDARGRHWHLFLPSPVHCTHAVRNPISEWFEALGLLDKRPPEKFIPDPIFQLPADQLALFLRHLWATDGCVFGGRNRLSVYYSTSSELLARQVQHLLLRFAIVARLRRVQNPGFRPSFVVQIEGTEPQLLFARTIGAPGRRGETLREYEPRLERIVTNPNHDTIPLEVWPLVKSKLRERGISHRMLADALGEPYCGSYLLGGRASSRKRIARIAQAITDEEVALLASSDVFWDTVRSTTADGEAEVYDALVPGTHSFVAGGLVVHNSGAIEMDADVVLFIYRDEVYNSDSPQRGIAEILVAKHRNGPIGKIELAFLEHYTKFANLARS